MTRVYTTYLPLVHAVCTHGFGRFRGFFDPLDRDDAVQTIFMAAFEERSRLAYNGIDPYAAFLRGIAHNVVRRMLESRKRFDRRPETLPPASPSLESELIEAETHAILRAFRDSIEDPRELEILNRYFCDGMSEDKLAAHLGMTRYKTRKLIAKLHKRMKRYLKDHGVVAP